MGDSIDYRPSKFAGFVIGLTMSYHITAQQGKTTRVRARDARAHGCQRSAQGIFSTKPAQLLNHFQLSWAPKKDPQNCSTPLKLRGRCEWPLKTGFSFPWERNIWVASLSSKMPLSFSLFSTVMLVWCITLLTVPQTSCSNAPYVQKPSACRNWS